MIGNRMRAFAITTAFAILAFAAPALASPFDGSWKMVLTTTNGHCGIISIGVAVMILDMMGFGPHASKTV